MRRVSVLSGVFLFTRKLAVYSVGLLTCGVRSNYHRVYSIQELYCSFVQNRDISSGNTADCQYGLGHLYLYRLYCNLTVPWLFIL